MERLSTPMLVAAVALLDDEKRVLMQRRRRDAVHGGLWEFPGGKVEGGETPESAGVREIEEELGIALAIDSLRPLAFASGPAATGGPPAGLVILLYTCRRWQGEIRCRAGESLHWFRPADLSTLAMPPLDYPLARALNENLQQISR